ncbi:peptide ABC transporter substrate-binding protein [Candidatus Halobeggiatoa sp. HSG11]|nr:peptide ABC transporter substrate-binding protein [Candidatus Halobeggiatoa sp. HSG11]
MFKFFIFSIIFLVLIGCEQQDVEVQSETSVSHSDCEDIKSCLRIPLGGKLKTIDPSMVNQVLDNIVVDQLFVGLTALKKDTYDVIPALATDWQISNDGKTYIFTLRQDITWNDGKPITAHDFVWTIYHNLNPKNKSSDASALFIIKNAEKFHKGEVDKTMIGLRVIGDYKLKFELEHAAGYFPSLVNLRIYRPLPKHVVSKHGKDWTKPKNIVTSGPYYLNKWEKGNKINLKKNPLYYEADKAKIQEIYYYIVQENYIGLTMYEKNDLDIMGGLYLKLPQTEIPRIEESAKLAKEIQKGAQGCTEWYGFNTQRFPTDNLNVRKAISTAVDKQLLLEVIFGDGNIPAATVTPAWLLSTNETVGLQFNPEQAQNFLQQAGYPDGKDFPEITLMRSTGETDDREVSKAIQTLLKHYLNFDIKVRDLPSNRYMGVVFGKPEERPHIFRIRWCADYPDANDFLYKLFHPTKGYFNWLLTDEKLRQELTEVIEKAQWVSDSAERKLLYQQVEKILVKDAAVVMPLYFDNVKFLIKHRVKGWYNMAFGGQHVINWSLEN